MRISRALIAVSVLALPLSGCAGGSGSGSDSGKPSVVVGFYPQEFLVERIAGDHVAVTSLAQPGADPHESELTPKQIGAVAQADLVVYAAGFQPSLDEAVTNESPAHVLDLSDIDDGHATDHADDHGADDGHGHAGDPHTWQNPELMKAMAHQVADQLAAVDPDNAAAYESAADRLGSELDTVDKEFQQGLAQCERREFVTTHTAFGYLAEAYDLTQMGITGLSPEQEPSAAKLAEVKKFVVDHGVSTIFYEDTVSPKFAVTVAEATGASTAVLYPLEAKPAVGDYLDGMRANLQALRSALTCT